MARYLLPADWLLYGALAAFALACTRFLAPGNVGKRLLLIGAGLSLGLGWTWLYTRQIAAPAAALSGTEQAVELTLRDYPSPTPYGMKATVQIAGVPGLAVWYGDSRYAGLEPGQTVRDTVRLQDAGRVREDDVSVFTSRGVFLLAYGQGKNADSTVSAVSAVVETGKENPLRWLPARTGKAVQDRISSFHADGPMTADEAAVLTALLTGDRSGLSVQSSTDLEEVGLTHVLAVSGMHCAFLLALLSLLLGRRRLLVALCAVPVLIFFALLTGGRPSVVRACIMLLALCAAPLFRRDRDSPTALAAALFLILFHNPYAAASVSLQLSFAAAAGLLWVTPAVYGFLTGPLREGVLFHWKELPFRVLRRLSYFLAANLSATLGALAFTAPLSAYYFGVLPLIAPLSGVLCLWAVGAAFITGLLAVLAGFLFPPLGTLAAWIPCLLLRYVLAVSHGLARVPGHAVYFANPLLKYWLAFAYVLCGTAFFVVKFRKAGHAGNTGKAGNGGKAGHAGIAGNAGNAALTAAFTAALLALSLFCTAFLYRTQYRHNLDAAVLDVGQGQSVLVASGGRYALADCGSANSWYNPGAIAARKLKSIGCRRLDVLLLTHFDADHVNGVEALLARIPVRELLIPDTGGGAGDTKGGNVDNAEDNAKDGADAETTTKARNAVLSLADRYGVAVRTVTEREVLSFGAGTLTVFPPVGASGDNDRGLSLLASCGDADFLITGDMGQAAEKKLMASCSLPDLEAFVAGHHGSKYSTSHALLDALTPETVCVSVGSNSYGHPAPETLDRLAARGCAVYRTDRDGDIHLILDG